MKKISKAFLIFATVIGILVQITIAVMTIGSVYIVAKSVGYEISHPYPWGYVSEEIYADVSGGAVINNFDTHGGFHGDGDTYIEMKMPLSFEEELKDNSEWQILPMSEIVRQQCDMHIDKPNDENWEKVIPDVKNGYYYYINRDPNSKWTPAHFTVAVYDFDTNILYYWERDL